MLTISGLSKAHGNRTLLRGVTFVLGDGGRVALVGAHGFGELHHDGDPSVSLEGDLAFTATHSGSHVNFSMRVESHSDWKLQVELSIGAGEDLSAARAEVARLFER